MGWLIIYTAGPTWNTINACWKHSGMAWKLKRDCGETGKKKKAITSEIKDPGGSTGSRVQMPKKLNGKTGPDFPPNGMPSTLVTPRRKNASKNFGVMSERKKMPRIGPYYLDKNAAIAISQDAGYWMLDTGSMRYFVDCIYSRKATRIAGSCAQRQRAVPFASIQ